VDEKLEQVMTPLMRDIDATAGLAIWLDDQPRKSPPDKYPSALLRTLDGSGTGVYVDRYAPLNDRFNQVEDVVRQAVIEARAEAGLPSTWPRCPDHPTQHPLSLNGDPWPAWCCPWAADGITVAPMGALKPVTDR
jgi:hypothetical protein